jgi:hypothetical protein
MTRLLVLVLLAVVLWLVLEAAWARLRIAIGVSARPLRPTAPPPAPLTETLVRCAGCGVHVPGRSMAGGLCERCRSLEARG